MAPMWLIRVPRILEMAHRQAPISGHAYPGRGEGEGEREGETRLGDTRTPPRSQEALALREERGGGGQAPVSCTCLEPAPALARPED